MKLTTPAETKNQFYLRFISDDALPREEVRRIYHKLKALAPQNLFGACNVRHPEKGITPVNLVHKTCKSGSHVYDIPLVRHIGDFEYERILSGFQGETVELEKSSKPINYTDQVLHRRSQFEPGIYDTFCDTIAKIQHNRWYAEQIQAGWRFGTAYDRENKVSPLLRPWDDLPSQYRKIDREFPQEIINELERLDFLVVPRTTLEKIVK